MTIFDYIIGLLAIIIGLPLWLFMALKEGGKK